jgi:predicted nucleotide-binding protein
MAKIFAKRLSATIPIPKSPCVFIGHGHSGLWVRVQLFLQNECRLEVVAFESESRVGESIVFVLKDMLRKATFAVFVLTGEDETTEGGKRARQNVVHEAGLFQGVLGFEKAILLVQKGLEEFSNVDGLQHISFDADKIEHTFFELQRVLKREKQIS